MGTKKITTQIKDKTYMILQSRSIKNHWTFQKTINKTLDKGLSYSDTQEKDVIDEILQLRKQISSVSEDTMQEILNESRKDLA